MTVKDQIKKGSSETLILALVADRPMYGYELTQELRKRSAGYFDMKDQGYHNPPLWVPAV